MQHVNSLLVAAGQVPAGSERGGGGAVHAEPDRRVRHRHHGRHGRAAAQPRPVLAQIGLPARQISLC